MLLKLDIDYKGQPFLVLTSYGKDIDDKMLEIFIREAKEKGVIFKNESGMDSCNRDYTIRINSEVK